MLCLGMHRNVMLRFMAQAFQDPPLCRSTVFVLWSLHLLSHGGENGENLWDIFQLGEEEVTLHFTLAQSGQHALQPEVRENILYTLYSQVHPLGTGCVVNKENAPVDST